MNSEVAKRRRSDLLATDAVNVSDLDFLMTHVAVNQIIPLRKFEMQPSSKERTDEEWVFQEFVRNPENLHQFVVVYGESGTGKSHFIRWLKNRFEASKPENEVILFIRRENNTLVSTIQQLIKLPEVQNLPNQDRYRNLSSAAKVEDRDELRMRILKILETKIWNEANPENSLFKNLDRQRIGTFLGSPYVRPYLSDPVDRIIARIQPSELSADRDLTAEFEPEDFDFVNTIEFEDVKENLDHQSKHFARKLQNDESNELKEKLAVYLNSFIESVIQETTGVGAEDLAGLFIEIRKELKKNGKNLTLFIEDITSFTGVDQSLLSALIVEHTGVDNEGQLCRLSSFVGTTNYYLNTYFKSNFQDRITQYFYLPKGIFSQEKLEQFFAKYLNAISLTREEIEQWAQRTPILNDSFPVADETERKDWEHVTISPDISLNLYPFTKNAVKNLYSTLKDKTPRYILKHLIEPNVSDVLFDKQKFPRQSEYLVQTSFSLIEALRGQFSDLQEEQRTERLLTNWGNGKPEMEILPSGQKMIAGLPETVLREFNIPDLSLKVRKSSRTANATLQQETRPKAVSSQARAAEPEAAEPEEDKNQISEEEKAVLDEVKERLIQWFHGQAMELRTSQRIDERVKNALTYLNTFILKSINWSQNGFTQAEVNQFRLKQLIKIEGATSSVYSDAILVLHQDNVADYRILETALRLSVLEKKHRLDYSGSLRDVFLITRWIEQNERQIVQILKKQFQSQAEDQVDQALTAVMISQGLEGKYQKYGDLKKLNLLELLSQEIKSGQKDQTRQPEKRAGEWKSLEVFLHKYFSELPSEIKYMFDLPQQVTSATPRSSGHIVLNPLSYVKTAEQVRSTFLSLVKKADGNKNDLIDRFRAAVMAEQERQKKELEKFDGVLSLDKASENRRIPAVCQNLIAGIEQNQEMRVKQIGLTEDERKKLEKLLKRFNDHVKALKKAETTSDPVEQAFLLHENSTEYLDQLRILLRKVSQMNLDIEKYIDKKAGQSGISSEELDQSMETVFQPQTAKTRLAEIRNFIQQMKQRDEYAS